MNEFVYKIALDLNCAKTPPTICSGQFDKGRKFEFTITANGEPYDVTECSAVLKGVRTGGSHFAVECTVSDGKIIIILDDTTLSVRGKTVAKLVISDSEKSYSTQIFIIDVDSALDGDITVSDDYSILNRLIEQIHSLNESGAILVDDTINSDSNNAVSNKAVATALAGKLNNTDGIKFVTTNSIDDCTDDKTLYRVHISDGSVSVGYHNLICINQSNYRSQYLFAQNGKIQYRTATKNSNGEWGEWSKWLAVVNNSDFSNGLAAKADKDTTYTKTEVDTALAGKADKATTLDGYGITDGENTGNKVSTIDFQNANTTDYISVAGLHNYHINFVMDLYDELDEKYDAANVETGVGTLTPYASSMDIIKSADFTYQRVGRIVTLNINIVFNAGTNSGVKFTNLPYVCKNTVNPRELCVTTQKVTHIWAVNKNGTMLNILSDSGVSYTDGETLAFTMSYLIS